MPKKIPMLGKTFGELTVVEEAERTSKQLKWKCQCTCGRHVIVQGANLRNGHTKTCGNCNRFTQEGDHMRCIVASGRSFIFDSEDLPLVQQHIWSVDRYGYAVGFRVKLHRLLMGNPKGVVDHINGNPSDCRKNNLRITTQHNNSMNSRLSKNSTTGYKGVCLDKNTGKYMAHIHPDGKMKFLGYYNSPIEAALAYDRAAAFYFGEYARLNFEKEETTDEEQEVLEVDESGTGNRSGRRGSRARP